MGAVLGKPQPTDDQGAMPPPKEDKLPLADKTSDQVARLVIEAMPTEVSLQPKALSPHPQPTHSDASTRAIAEKLVSPSGSPLPPEQALKMILSDQSPQKMERILDYLTQKRLEGEGDVFNTIGEDCYTAVQNLATEEIRASANRDPESEIFKKMSRYHELGILTFGETHSAVQHPTVRAGICAYYQQELLSEIAKNNVNAFRMTLGVCAYSSLTTDDLSRDYSSYTAKSVSKPEFEGLQKWLMFHSRVEQAFMTQDFNALKDTLAEAEKEGVPIPLDAIITAEASKRLVNLDKKALFSLLGKWETAFADSPALSEKFASTILAIEVPSQAKEARTVVQAHLQTTMLAALSSDDQTKFEHSLERSRRLGVPMHKLLKNYEETTKKQLTTPDKEKLQRNILKSEIAVAVKKNDQEAIKSLFKEFAKGKAAAPLFIKFLFDDNKLTGPEYAPLRDLLTLADTLFKHFRGETPASTTLNTIVKDAKEKKLNVAELLNLAQELHEARGGQPNERTLAAFDQAYTDAKPAGAALAHDLVKALGANNQAEIKRVMQEVERLAIGPQFPLFLEKVADGILDPSQKEIAERVVGIYLAMSALPIAEHRLSPHEMVLSSIIAERDLRAEKAAPAALAKETGTRTRVVDLTKRQVTYLNKSKGGKLNAFGTYKKVTSAVTIRPLSVQAGQRPRFIAESRSLVTLKKGMSIFPSARSEWLEEIKSLDQYRGLKGLLNYETVVEYTRRIGGKRIPTQIVLMKIYERGDLWSLKGQAVPIEAYIGYYADIGEGLRNLHHYQENPDGTMSAEARLHGDIKTPNLLAAADGSAAIGDYGFQSCPNKGGSMPLSQPYYGTPGFSDPEVTILALSAAKAGKSFQEGVKAHPNPFAFDNFATGTSMLDSLGKRPPSMLQQEKDYTNGKKVTLEEAVDLKKQFEKEYNEAVQRLKSLSHPSFQEQFELIAWKMCHPDHTQRMTADQYRAAMRKLKADATHNSAV